MGVVGLVHVHVGGLVQLLVGLVQLVGGLVHVDGLGEVHMTWGSMLVHVCGLMGVHGLRGDTNILDKIGLGGSGGLFGPC